MVSITRTSNQDWNKFIKENDINIEDVDYYLENVLDTPEFNKTYGKVYNIKNDTYVRKKSNIHGFGIFAKKDINKGEVIGIVCVVIKNENYRSYMGRFTNHSSIKNVSFIKTNPDTIVALCVKNIKDGEEILVDYRDHFMKW